MGDNLPLGAKPNKEKGVNERKRDAAEARKQARNEDPVQAQDPIDEFGDGSTIRKEWRGVPMVIGSVFNQLFDICWAIALTRLLQAVFNLHQKSVADCKEFLRDDLVAHLKLKKKSSSRTWLKLSNLKDAVKHIAVKGLLKIKSTGHSRAGSEIGFHGKWNFEIKKSPSADFIKSKVDLSPDFQFIGKKWKKGKYKDTKDDQLFFVTQNSWGDKWGVKGYGRIFIEDHTRISGNLNLIRPGKDYLEVCLFLILFNP